EAGTFPVTITLRDGSNQTSVNETLNVYQQPSLSAQTYPDAYVGEPYNAAAPSASGGKGSLTWSASTVPFGLTFNNGSLSGTPTGGSVGSPTNFTMTVSDENGESGTQSYSITAYAPLSVASDDVPEVTTGDTFTHTFTATGGK